MENENLSNRQKKAIKLLGLLSLIRWYSIILIGLAQYLAAFFVFNPHSPKVLLIFDFKLHGIVLATAILVAAGYIINAFYDFEKDLINKPKETIINTVISTNSGLNFYFLLNFIGLFIAFIASTKIFLFFFAFSFALWIYSHKLQKIALIREITASLLTVSAFFSIVLHFNRLDLHVFLYGSMLFTIILIRELCKEFLNKKGDVIYGYETFLVKYGKKWTIRVIYILVGLSIIIPVMYGMITTHDYAVYVLAIQLLGLFYSLGLLNKMDSKKNLESINLLYKVLLVIGIVGIPFVS